jgi:hypothetical protein
MSLLLAHTACQSCLYMLNVRVERPCCMFLLHVIGTSPSCMSKLYVNTASPWTGWGNQLWTNIFLVCRSSCLTVALETMAYQQRQNEW